MTLFALIFFTVSLNINPVSGDVTLKNLDTSTLPYLLSSKDNCEKSFEAIQEQNPTTEYDHYCKPITIK